MFTIEQINAAHAEVKTGTDYPRYVQELIKMGIYSYQTFVKDGSTIYYGKNDYKLTSPAKYETLQVVPISNKAQFIADLSRHQQGQSNFYTFCKQCAASGIKKWTVDLAKMTCIYYNQTDEEILAESIPVI